MARPGPPKKPSALEDLQGRPGHRPKNTAEPKPAAVTSIKPPAWLDQPAREVWNHLAPELHRLGLLTVVDVPVLAGACRWWAIYRAADAVLRRRVAARPPRKPLPEGKRLEVGLTDETKANGRQAVAEVAIAQKAWKEAADAFAKFGIFPAERTRVQAPQPKGVESGDGNGPPSPPKDPHDQLAERRRRRAERAAAAG